MIRQYFVYPKVLKRLREGAMAPYLDGFARELQEQRYSRKSIRRQLRNAAAFGRWLADQTIRLGEVTRSLVSASIGTRNRGADYEHNGCTTRACCSLAAVLLY